MIAAEPDVHLVPDPRLRSTAVGSCQTHRPSPLSPETMAAPPPPDPYFAVRRALRAGNKIEAIKLFRQQTGVDLAQAKEAVEQMTLEAPATSAIPQAPNSEIHQALFARKKIAAIKLYREQFHVGLAEAKSAVEAIEAQLSQTAPDRFSPLPKGCFALAALSLTAGAIFAIAAARAQDTSSSSRPPIMGSAVFDWAEIPAHKTPIGESRKFFRAPTATLDELECHVTTLNPGEQAHPPHQHPDEELLIVKEGTVEALVNGEWKRIGPGSVIFQASNILHAIRNVGDTPATYHVIKWNSPGMLARKSAQADAH